MLSNLSRYQLILGSASPRRQQLLAGLGVPFRVEVRETDESFSNQLQGHEIPVHIAGCKADAFSNDLGENDVVITADTVVWINGHALNKPSDRSDAIKMISELSGNTHEVYTAVCVLTKTGKTIIWDETKVHFSRLDQDEIEFYVDQYKPFDKAGAYGAQDWIGLVGIDKLEGSYFNVMGLPVHKLYALLKQI
jgi:septum formation protein